MRLTTPLALDEGRKMRSLFPIAAALVIFGCATTSAQNAVPSHIASPVADQDMILRVVGLLRFLAEEATGFLLAENVPNSPRRPELFHGDVIDPRLDRLKPDQHTPSNGGDQDTSEVHLPRRRQR